MYLAYKNGVIGLAALNILAWTSYILVLVHILAGSHAGHPGYTLQHALPALVLRAHAQRRARLAMRLGIEPFTRQPLSTPIM